MSNMKNEDIINRYLFDEMTAEEKVSYEIELETNEELKHEVFLQQEIIYAVRKKALKERFVKLERQIRAEENRRKVFTIRIAAAAMAACLVVGVFVDYDNRGDYKDYAAGIIIAQAAPARGERDIVNEVVIEINDKNYAEALALIDEAAAMEIDAREQQDLEWYKAVTYMHMGKWMKARKLLKQIAASDSIHKADAEKALEEL